MSFDLKSDDIMEYLWMQLDKTPDGKYIRYTQDDVDSLWFTGFVDTKKYALEIWQDAFKPFKQADGTYRLDHNAFMSLNQYRYTGEVRVPFDAMLINEGRYTDVGLGELFDLSIGPSCALLEKDLNKFIEDFKNKYRQPNGLIIMNREGKLMIRDLIDNYPSPLRNLEITLEMMIQEGLEQQVVEGAEADDTAKATIAAAKQVSTFTSTASSRTEIQSKRLKDLQGVKPKQQATAQEDEKKKKTVDLKSIRRSKKGMRG